MNKFRLSTKKQIIRKDISPTMIQEVNILLPKTIQSTKNSILSIIQMKNTSLSMMLTAILHTLSPSMRLSNLSMLSLMHNGGIAGQDMLLLMYDSNSCVANIGVAGDHQMMVNRIGTFCSVIETQKGLILPI